MNSIKKININPNDISKINKESISFITLTDGTILICNENMPLQDINKLINNKNENINHYENFSTINNNYGKNNGKKIETIDIGFNNPQKNIIINKYNKNSNYYSLNVNKSTTNKKLEENKNNEIYKNEKMEYKSKNQTISDIVNEKFHKKFKNNIKENRIPIKSTINSEININIKGKETKNGLDNLLNDFNELLSNFNYKKKGIQNNMKDKNKYKYYKKNIIAKKDQLFMENLSIISPNAKTIKYIGRNENNTELNEKNLLRLNITKNKVPYLKEKQALKRNKSNHIYFLKNSKFSNIISPPNYLNCEKMKFL